MQQVQELQSPDSWLVGVFVVGQYRHFDFGSNFPGSRSNLSSGGTSSHFIADDLGSGDGSGIVRRWVCQYKEGLIDG